MHNFEVPQRGEISHTRWQTICSVSETKKQQQDETLHLDFLKAGRGGGGGSHM